MIVKRIFYKYKKEQANRKKRKIQQYKAADSFFKDISTYDENSVYEGHNYLNSGVVFSGKIGYGSYIGSNSKMPHTVIGRYCSIAWNVELISGSHPTKTFVSTHPAFFSTLKQAGFTYVKENKYDEYKYADIEHKYRLVIGNDVWIGANVILLEGITIGDGAVIGAGSVVTKDVPPYAIVGGSPAKVIHYRFSKDDINFLLTIKWWNKDKTWIETHASCFCDIDFFKERISIENEK